MRFFLVSAFIFLTPAISFALTAEKIISKGGTPEEIGERIAKEVDDRDFGFTDSKSEMKMILENSAGETSEREMRQEILENPDPDDGDKSIVVFDRPRDINGTALLSYAHYTESDDQWLYLPALKRVKRISSQNKSGPFMGSEFAYEDFTASEMVKYKYKYLRDERCGELECFVLERFPIYENSGYTRQIGWIDKNEFILRKLNFYDRKNDLLKTLTFSGYKKYLGKYWRAHDMFMVNHQTNKKTRLLSSGIEFRIGLGENNFNKDALKRAR